MYKNGSPGAGVFEFDQPDVEDGNSRPDHFVSDTSLLTISDCPSVSGLKGQLDSIPGKDEVSECDSSSVLPQATQYQSLQSNYRSQRSPFSVRGRPRRRRGRPRLKFYVPSCQRSSNLFTGADSSSIQSSNSFENDPSSCQIGFGVKKENSIQNFDPNPLLISNVEDYPEMPGKGIDKLKGEKGEKKKLIPTISLQESKEAANGSADNSKLGRKAIRGKKRKYSNADATSASENSASSITLSVNQKRYRKDGSEEVIAVKKEGNSDREFEEFGDADLTSRRNIRTKSLVDVDSEVLPSTRGTRLLSAFGTRGRRARGRGRLISSLPSARGRESPLSESSVESVGSRNRRLAGEHSSSNSGAFPAPISKSRGRSISRRVRGRMLSPRRGRLSTSDTASFRGFEPSSYRDSSPAGSVGGLDSDSKSAKKKKKKYFKGLKYSFVKKKKPKPKVKLADIQSVIDTYQESESPASVDADVDAESSLDSSSQVTQVDFDPYDPSAEFDDNPSENSPLSLHPRQKNGGEDEADVAELETAEDVEDMSNPEAQGNEDSTEAEPAEGEEIDWDLYNAGDSDVEQDDETVPPEEVVEGDNEEYIYDMEETYDVENDEITFGDVEYDDDDDDNEQVNRNDKDEYVVHEENLEELDENGSYTEEQDPERCEETYEGQGNNELEVDAEESNGSGAGVENGALKIDFGTGELEYEQDGQDQDNEKSDNDEQDSTNDKESEFEEGVIDPVQNDLSSKVVEKFEGDDTTEDQMSEVNEYGDNEDIVDSYPKDVETDEDADQVHGKMNGLHEGELVSKPSAHIENKNRSIVPCITKSPKVKLKKMDNDLIEKVLNSSSDSVKQEPEENHVEENKLLLDVAKKDESVRKSKRVTRSVVTRHLAIAISARPKTEADTEELDSSFTVADPSLINILCKCRQRDNPRAVNFGGDIYCQAMDSFDGRIIGCCNIVSNFRYLRVSGKIPFMLLCSIHRQRLRRHNCCPGCGLFCTQGVFSECRWHKSGPRHYYHKLCGLAIKGVSYCPHCGTDQPPQEIHLELKLSRKPVVYLKQHQEKKGFTSSARMSLSKTLMVSADTGSNVEPEDPALTLDSGQVVSAAGFPVGLDKERLIAAITAIKIGKQINVKFSSKGIYWSCKQGDLEKLLFLIVNGVSPNARIKEYGNQCGLHTAVSNGCLPAVHILVLAGATLDVTDMQLQTPLMIALAKGFNDILKYLIMAGANLNAKTEDNMTCLHLASKSGNFTACKHILDSGRLTRHSINIQDEGGWTPLVWASENRCISVVKTLLDRGANPQICDVEQNTALHWAAFSGSSHICSMVLDRGCSIRSMNGIGDSPLHIASRQNHVEAVALLLARGASIEIRNARGQTPIDCAIPESEVYLQMTLNLKLREVVDNNGFRNERILNSDIAAGKESVPIPCVNGIDDEHTPKDYIYIAENCEALNVNIDRTINSLKWCECEDGCSTDSCFCTQLNFQCWYDPEGRLLSEFNYADPPMIFECNRACGCNKLSCHNRVVQHGMTSHLQLFRTQGKGWGIRALKDIPKGTYVCEYVGEILTDLEADLREDDSYLFDLDNRDNETFCIDARQYGNVARFINHLCSPNLTPVKIFIDHQDLLFPRIALFANRDIEADEELGFDYGEKFWIIKYKEFTCQCGLDICKYSESTIQETLENYNKKMKEQQMKENENGPTEQ